MKRQIPILICFLSGLFILLQYFSPHPLLDGWKKTLLNWVVIIGIFAFGLGLVSLWMSHFPKIRSRKPGWGYSALTLASFVITVLVASVWGKSEGTPFLWIYNKVQYPIQGTMFALLAFFIASAAYRAFRVRTILATVLLAAAVIVMLGRVPLGDWLTAGYAASLADWLLNYPNLAAKRAIFVGVGFGGAAVALRVLVGIERSYMGTGD
jgi:hypothetical protein